MSVKLWGGLGNQLFQIFTVIATAKDRNLKFVFKKEIDYFSRRKTYWDTILRNLKPHTVDTIDYLTPIQFRPVENELNHHIPERKLESDDLYLLIGYFQSHLYFDHMFHYIYTLLGIDDFKHELLERYAPLFNTPNTISLHFRIGDYSHPYNKNVPGLEILKMEYYIAALSTFNADIHYRVVCFGEKENLYEIQDRINTLRCLFPSFEFVFADLDAEDWQQMILMSLCKHNIIANSTFSYFGAYFNTHADKQVYYPDLMIPRSPATWTKIECARS
jgi:hypothetical protein